MEVSLQLIMKAKKGCKKSIAILEGIFLKSTLARIRKLISSFGNSLVEAEDYLLNYHNAVLKSLSLFDNKKGTFDSLLMRVLIRSVNTDLIEQMDYQRQILSLDAITSETGSDAHDIVACSDSFENDPTKYVEENEILDIVFKKRPHLTKKENAKNKIQRNYISLMMRGYNRKEINSKFKYCSSTMRRIMKDDGPNTILGDLKKYHNSLKNK